jgi:non-heme chloroperoxidase
MARLGRRPDPDRPDPERPDPERFECVTTGDGASLHVAVRGSGPPVVLVHGVTLTSQVWTRQWASWPDRGLTVVTYDQRGHGRSRVGSAPWSMATFANDLAAVLEALALTDAVVVGHSMGGITTQALLLDHPEVVAARLRGVVLLSTTARPHVGTTRRIRLATRRLLPRFDPAKVMAHPVVGRVLARIGFGRDPRSEDVELTRRLLAACDPETSRGAVRAVFDFDATARLGEVALPTLVVGGTRDVITRPRDARRLARSIPGARLEELDGAGHMAMLERPEELEELIVGFVRAVVPGPAAARGVFGQT